MIKAFIIILIIIDLVLVVFSLIFYDAYYLLNTQIAFLSSLLVCLASFFGYRNSILKKISKLDNAKSLKNDEDELSKIDDIHGLFEDEKNQEKLSEDEKEENKDFKQIFKEEKLKAKAKLFKNLFTSSFAFVSFYRIFAYIFLILGFFSLVNHHIFITFGYLLGLVLVPLGIILANIIHIIFNHFRAKKAKKS